MNEIEQAKARLTQSLTKQQVEDLLLIIGNVEADGPPNRDGYVVDGEEAMRDAIASEVKSMIERPCAAEGCEDMAAIDAEDGLCAGCFKARDRQAEERTEQLDWERRRREMI